ncbi:glyoxylase-like metal-dependent hydrolase (beta-lactamase superfamily II) [Clostridium acetobutylicum]|uniref:Zn-dependent hydrolase, glyoxylase II family n=1 Tax=Clostridium acetobutylicum (strain ATCC 824 / DSM 792 / JCM 1419 / IAM 19013 / LMG 5710 / NBRC 13948 / NRRL B-527 / VKM B-1787 / 2291 / W) TaxID=272562 RepID=Q97J62_CLOAB|nr:MULTISPECIES: MBL fold metallo-hydrolase [Clostridium]AAK79392.1 Zn-dependent hydrolase, glyoxylase II family [Clostridium acetobutylicum ATCC 824]ADZ20477.1 Zn-dependent hydrolase, glyoxylase II family [Clostridium acetobutylicum EA 2018]AEI31798.1 zinc-dependent hydrolase [Clostridium acetobutylicum DSM 1731]AWV81359.1 MBL fold metallo-hydrolase [Clostridium acetobutylicum]MBC2392993.1 MBL fold metallo-hydrolase [Clostridium acetobutylicum]
MKLKKLNKSTYIFTYDNIKEYSTNVFLIKKKNRVYVIDTFCGTKSMEPITNEIGDKEICVINTHFHWDHIFGNSAFKDAIIISHKKCRKILEESWDSQLKENERYVLGSAEKCIPNLTFKSEIMFEEDGIEIFYSPGHTEDSISIFDHESRILYVGDNLEKPIVYVENSDIDAYMSTLKKYIEYDADKIFAGHTLNLTTEDILDTINYLEALKRGDKLEFDTEHERKVHSDNVNMVFTKGEITNGKLKD